MADSPPYTDAQLAALKAAAEKGAAAGTGQGTKAYSEAVAAMKTYQAQQTTPPPSAGLTPAQATAQQQSQKSPGTLSVAAGSGSVFSTFMSGQQTGNQSAPLGLFPVGVGGQLSYISTEFKQFQGKPVPGGGTFESKVTELMNANQTGSLIDIQQKLIKAGFLDPSTTGFTPGTVAFNDPTFKAYEKFLSTSLGQTGKISDLDSYLVSLGTNNAKGAQYAAKYGSMFGGAPITLTATHQTVPSAPDLQGDFRGKFQNLVGGDPTPEQYKNFVAAAQAFAKANPELVTTEYTTGPGGSLRFPQAKDIATQGGLSQTGMDQFEQSYIAKNMGGQEATSGVNSLIGQFQQMLGVK